MGRRLKDKDRIDKIFTELRAKGKLPPVKPKAPSKPKAPTKRKGTKVEYVCCLDRHEGNLPMNFRPCIDCPKTKAMQNGA